MQAQRAKLITAVSSQAWAISAASGCPSVSRPSFICSARMKSRILKSRWAENRAWP